ncbi:SemiSWEET family sugar transporter [Paludibacterium paludis]|uniref:MtN3 and saliva related transmembrane protein n=1 Tax=Paludibacterium paludis TaxID=1225769 RepID=A0A918P5B4_9NEIS|nr:SemiSWEET family transporter [Paludibacterium paludis]GGY25285.1 hypothetical protein GCM10011289_31070 [Paludibacterium paludis]
MQTPPRQRWIATYMAIVGPLGNMLFYFQAYQIFHDRTAGSVSLPGFAISLVALSSWLAYGIHIKDKPLVIANAVGLLGAIWVVIGIVRYTFGS